MTLISDGCLYIFFIFPYCPIRGNFGPIVDDPERLSDQDNRMKEKKKKINNKNKF